MTSDRPPWETLSFDDTDSASGRAASTAPAEGVVGGRYHLRRLLGQGGMGRVYLARDSVLGRSVALKLIRPERVTSAHIESFVQEAQITAQLNHPHIVQIYDVGRDAESTFLALEYLEGDTLKQRNAQALSIDEILRIARSIAEALCHAHAANVFHCDLKPSNVMLPDDGRVRVVDFGLASIGTEHRLGGTPDWMAPEQWRHEPPGPGVDVWALAVIIHELLTGSHPFGAARTADERRAQILDPDLAPAIVVRDGLPEVISALILRSLHRDPATRPSTEEWARVLREVTESPNALRDTDSPFRGLAPFEERHAQFFFGREAESDMFLERLRHEPIIPIVGPSGAGKSSFLFAGVIPRLRARERWRVISMRPGPEPFVTLARELLQVTETEPASDDIHHLARDLDATPSLLAGRLATLSLARRANVLLVCDQVEELFTQSLDAEAAQRFAEMLMSAADDPRDPVRVTFTLREDFLGHVPTIRSLFVLRRLGRSDLRRVVMRPLEQLGYRFEDPDNVDEMLREVTASTFDLPLLQFACRTLWDARDLERRLLLSTVFRDYGGVARALAKHADGVLAEMSSSQQRIARNVFGRLVVGVSARKTVSLEALVEGLAPEASSVVDRLVSARLLVSRRVPGDDTTFVEIAHESLLETWGQLAQWLEESREERRFVHELEEAADFWHRRGERPEHAPTDNELVVARERIARFGITVPARVEAMLVSAGLRRQSQRRRAMWRRAIIAAIGLVVTLGSLYLARTYRAQKTAAERQAAQLRLAAANLGRVKVIVELFDDVSANAAAPANDFRDLSISVFPANGGDVYLPAAAPLAGAQIERTADGTFEIEAPGGLLFLRISGRGRPSESCADSWVRVQTFPGYAEHRAGGPPLTLKVPSCRGSARETVAIPAGEFVYGGPGVEPTKIAAYVEAERIVNLAAFAIDRFEVSNAAFHLFADLSPTTGYPVPRYPDSGELGGGPDEPVTSIDAFEAEAFCRYMGKRLPSDFEWTKAARGGLVVDGRPNPIPRRLYPWGSKLDPRCVNRDGEEDGFAWAAPVDALSCGQSPYGVFNLAGNVAEWISRNGQLDHETPLHEVRGGAADSPATLEQVTTVFRNLREARHFDFVIGIRCVTDGDIIGGSQWLEH